MRTSVEKMKAMTLKIYDAGCRGMWRLIAPLVLLVSKDSTVRIKISDLSNAWVITRKQMSLGTLMKVIKFVDIEENIPKVEISAIFRFFWEIWTVRISTQGTESIIFEQNASLRWKSIRFIPLCNKWSSFQRKTRVCTCRSFSLITLSDISDNQDSHTRQKGCDFFYRTVSSSIRLLVEISTKEIKMHVLMN